MVKVLPFLGVPIGTGMAIWQVKKGNYGYAAGEMAAGLASLIPV